MGLLAPDLPPQNLETWNQRPHLERMKLLSQHWAEYGFGTPRAIHLMYAVKVIAYAALGLFIISLIPGLGGFTDFTSWWNQPIVFQKAIVWTMLWEIIGLGASSGPLAFRFAPPIGGALFWLRPGTIRLAPWPNKVPGTKGATRSALDVALYVAIIATEIVLLMSSGSVDASAPGDAGLLPTAPLVILILVMAIGGLRDKLLFLASRGEQYWVFAIMFATFPFVDMIIGAKLVMFVVWWGAATSKIGHHFTFVVTAMMSNAPLFKPRSLRRALYRNFPEDLRPSKFAFVLAHTGTLIEFLIPVVLLFSTNRTLTALAVAVIIIFHLFITSNFPLAVPLEWNVMYMFGAWFLFWNFPAGDGFGLGNFSSTGALIAVIAALLFFPVLGNLRPDLVSFLPSMRYYAGNWAVSQWAFRRGPEPRTGAEQKMEDSVFSSSPTQVSQLTALYGNDVAEVFVQKAVAWRSMHSHGRALNTLMGRHLDSYDNYDIREGEFVCATLTGWQFGDGHLHDERLLAEVQRQTGFAEGDCVVVMIESEPIFRGRLQYRVVDAAVGELERGSFAVADQLDQQGWLDKGPIPLDVESTTHSDAGSATLSS